MYVSIIGAGFIAQKMAKTLLAMDGITPYAIASRDLARAQTFCEAFEFKCAYGSYQALLEDPMVELVYVATPHSHHYRHIKLCLEAGKHVLCEKAFTVTATQAKELFALAHEKNLFLAEAMWTRYLPARAIMESVLSSGILGDICSLNGVIGYYLMDKERIVRPELAGGALLDLSGYLLHITRMIFSEPIVKIVSSAVQTHQQVDLIDNIILHFNSGKVACLHATAMGHCNMLVSVYGSKGFMEIENANNPSKISVFDNQRQLIAQYTPPPQITGFEYEVAASVAAIEDGTLYCAENPPAETIAVLELMDQLRKDWNYEIPTI